MKHWKLMYGILKGAALAFVLPSLAHAAPLQQATEERGLLGPLVVLIIIVLLNIAVLAVAFRLRRIFHQIGGENEDEQTVFPE